ncbi:MAG TPA: permease [Acidimicrobiales bacterium]|nr:permease [Acidimicrobiales bacterium]
MIGGINLLGDVGSGLREGFFMFWETLWALVFGFGLSGMVQAFVPKEQMERVMGDHGPRAVTRASFLGMVSSSCSYAATAMAKSLFQKGADFVTAMVFMFASTNLVVELGIVLVVLMGWQFAASEFVGGAIMIVLLVLLGAAFLGGRAVAAARQRLAEPDDAPPTGAPGTDAREHHGGHANGALGVDDGHKSDGNGRPAADAGWRTRIRDRGAWADAATYTMSDLTMLRRELLIGYVVAGFLAVLVPVHFWNAVFLHGHGFWTSLENVIVGPFIAIISFVCSIGNVPLAAALWGGGISFGGVVSFLFADLITFPLLLVYRRYYGIQLTLRLLAVFWVVMSLAGLATEGIFRAAGLVPTNRSVAITASHFSWDYTTYLNIVFLGLFAVVYWLYRHREPLGAGGQYARDPICGMQVRKADAPARAVDDGQPVYFCSDRCHDRYGVAPDAPHAPADVAEQRLRQDS